MTNWKNLKCNAPCEECAILIKYPTGDYAVAKFRNNFVRLYQQESGIYDNYAWRINCACFDGCQYINLDEIPNG